MLAASMLAATCQRLGSSPARSSRASTLVNRPLMVITPRYLHPHTACECVEPYCQGIIFLPIHRVSERPASKTPGSETVEPSISGPKPREYTASDRDAQRGDGP